MNCSKCGKILDDDASFCGSCGKKQYANANFNQDKNQNHDYDNDKNNDKYKYNFSDYDFQNIVFTPAKKAELIAMLKKVGIVLIALILAIFILSSISSSDYDINKGIIHEYHGNATSIATPKNANEIGEWAFFDNKSIKTITLNDNVTKINTGAFEGCTSLTMITIPESVIEIGDWILAECWSLTTVRVKSGSFADAWARTYKFHSNVNIEYY